jgi:HPt (histidine-containing phosphotransfer) domain-containing protein
MDKRFKKKIEKKLVLVDSKSIEAAQKITNKNGNTMFDDLFATFSQLSPDLVDQIERAYNESDLVKMSARAHSLKTMSSNLGLHSLRDCCIHIEKHAEDILNKSDETAIENLRKVFLESFESLYEYTSEFINIKQAA